MAINYPTSKDNLTNPTTSDTLYSVKHSEQHSNANDAIEALETKLGIGDDTPQADEVLVGDGTGSSSWTPRSEFKGDKGDTGNAATVDVGTTTTGDAGTDASVVNSGTTSAAILDFTIPRGPQGIQGIQGIQGEIGLTGPQGIQGEKGDKGDTGLGITEETVGFTLTGGTTPKTLTVALDANVSGTNTGDQDLSGYVPTTRQVNGHSLSADVTVTKTDVGLGNVSDVAQMPASYLDTDSSLTANSDSKVPSQKAIKTYADQLIGTANALVYKGVIDCSGNPNYPAADAGFMYIVSVAGKVGGASGVVVEVGDMCICNTDSTSSGDQSTVGTKWNIIEKNIVGAVTGPASATDNHVVFFDSTTGKIIKDSGLTLSGTNTGDQTSIVGITGTTAQFNTALTDNDFATLAGSETITNKTINDSTNYVDADATHLKVLLNLGSSSTLGMPVYGSVWNIANAAVEVGKARANAAGTMPCIGLMETAGADGSVGSVRTNGVLNNVNTNSWSEGAALYISTSSSGTLTTTKPTGSSGFVQRVGTVLRQSATVGVIEVQLGTPIDLSVPAVSVTTKGDIQTFSTVPDRLAVGATNGHVLTVDSTAATGIKWAAAAGGSDATSNVRNEVPSGTINSSNTAFTLANTPLTGSLRVYLNGQRLTVTNDYTISGTSLTMVIAPTTGDTLLVDYEINSGTYSTGSASWVSNETPSGTVNGSNQTFTLVSSPISGSLALYRDGQLMTGGGADYTLTANSISFTTAPVTGSVLLAFYQSVASTAGNADTLDGFHASDYANPSGGQLTTDYQGWQKVNESWSYASASTITVASGAASRYQKGDKIKFTQTTAKYFYVVGVADTVLTVTGGTDYTVANAAISAIYVSREDNPFGFPGSFNFLPSVTPAGSMTYTSTNSNGRFSIHGKMLVWHMMINGTVGGTPSNYIEITLPVAPLQPQYNLGGGAMYGNSVTLQSAYWSNFGSSTAFRLSKYNNANLDAGASQSFHASIVYSI